MADDASVKVAVRVRPFNSREVGMGAKVIIKMNGNSTTIVNPETEKEKTFAFDYSYWSHDGFKVDEEGWSVKENEKSNYASQRTVYDDIGEGILKDAFNGFNCSLFAYGQTGAGKSYSMVGYGVNKGIIPIVCDELFKKMLTNENPDIRYEVTVSMLEIYNEQVRDLLNPKINPPGGLKVRQKPGIGVYVDNLTPIPVTTYAEVDAAMNEGTKNRTVASTQMNATSSRAHTVFTIMFTTVSKNEAGEDSEVTSKINLVDLAGSERANSTGATGDRLKEGSAINQSLSALGNVISALADKAMGKKKVFIPYRNSVLTRLLQDALGGNSKTIMIAALSPADVNYDETLSTLRYADRAKKIKNAVQKNENPTDKIIRELKEENERLMKLLGGQGIDTSAPAAGGDGGDASGSGGNSEAEAALRKQLEEQMQENQRIMENMSKSWEQKLQEAMAAREANGEGALSAQSAAGLSLPRILNLHEDPMLSECVMYVFKAGETKIGRKSPEGGNDVELNGLNMKKNHAVLTNQDGEVTLTPLEASKTFVNGDLITSATVLKEGDRIILGNNFVFRFHDPKVEDAEGGMDWTAAMDEFTTKQGLRLQQDLSGSVDKLEAEEAKKREELEEKLREMEAAIAEERQKAKDALAMQRQMLEGGDISEADKEKLKAVEDAFTAKAANLEEELKKKKEVSEKIIQEQMKRKRETKTIQRNLDALLPKIHEANSISTELVKNVQFEARLSVKSPKQVNLSPMDELKNIKKISVSIRVCNTQDGSVWTWSHDKFENRLFMMRELYQDFMNYGPREVDQANDPFWDPPEATEIGKAYVYLKALSQLVEIENEFVIVDYKGEEQGHIQVEVFPEDDQGDELDYLQSSEEILGKSINLNLKIPSARGLPSKFCNDCYVSYTFMDETFETDAFPSKATDPKWAYQYNFKLDNVDEKVRQYLLTEAIVFEVKGFTDAQSSGANAQAPAGSNATVHRGGPLCEQCEEQTSVWDCEDCSRTFCGGCFDLLHKSKKKRDHSKRPIDVSSDAPSFEEGAAGGACEHCEEQTAAVSCLDCSKNLCGDCNSVLHKSARKQAHQRIPVDGQASSGGSGGGGAPSGTVPVCSQCEEVDAILSCTDCDRAFCESCNAVLHKSKKKATHARAFFDGTSFVV